MQKIKGFGLILCLYFSFTLITQAQSIKILDKTDLEPIVGAVIFNKDTTFKAITNEKGDVEITGLLDADTLIFKHLGYGITKWNVGDIRKNNATIYLSAQSTMMEEVVLSANRAMEKRKDIAQNIVIIKAKDIALLNAQQTADMLALSGNVFVQKSQMGGGSPIIRGFEANRVLLVVDGIRMNNAIYRGGHLQNAITLDANILERVEIVEGPGSVMYGSDALGGVIHFYTKMPQLSIVDSNFKCTDRMTINAGINYLRYSSANNEKSGSATLNIGLTKVALLTTFTTSYFGDLITGNVRDEKYPDFGKRLYYADGDSMIKNPNPNLQIGTAYNQWDLMQKILYKPSEKIQHLLNFQLSKSSNIPRYDRLSEMKDNLMRFSEWYYGPQERMLISYQLKLNLGNKLFDKGNIILAYQNIGESRIVRAFRNPIRTHNIEKVKAFSLNADFMKDIGKNELRYGLEMVANLVNSSAFGEEKNTGAQSFLTTRYPNNSFMGNYAIYFSHRYEFSPKFILSDGVRFGYVNLMAKLDTPNYLLPNVSVNQQNISYNGHLGAVWMPTENWRFTTSFATGFRAPNIDDMGKVFEFAPNQIIVPNPNLKPENIYSGELNLGRKLGKNIWINTLGYYSYFVNMIGVNPFKFGELDSVFTTQGWQKTYANTNFDKVTIWGLGTTISGEINQHFSINSSIQFTKGQIQNESKTPLDHIPPLFGQFRLMYKAKRLSTELSTQWNAMKKISTYRLNAEDNERYATPDGMPAWYRIDLRINYQIFTYFQAQFYIENLLDIHYRTFGSGVSAAGRNFGIVLRTK